jgi:hypothetical protein
MVKDYKDRKILSTVYNLQKANNRLLKQSIIFDIPKL